MTLDRKPFVPQSFSRVMMQPGRALAGFVAIAHAALPESKNPLAPVRMLVLSAVLLVLGLTARGIWQPALCLFGLILLVLAVFTGWRSDAPSFLRSPEHRKRVARARLLAKLDSARTSVGLEEVIDRPLLNDLETAAMQWEKAEHILSGQTWQFEAGLKARAEQDAFESMLDVLSLSLGSPVAEGMSSVEAADRRREQSRHLEALVETLEAATTVMSSYPRANDLPSGAPSGLAFPELANLESLLPPVS